LSSDKSAVKCRLGLEKQRQSRDESGELTNSKGGRSIQSSRGNTGGAELTAILFADIYGYGLLMGRDEEAMLRTMSAYRTMIHSHESHCGRFANPPKSSSGLIEAVNFTVEIQNERKAENTGLPRVRWLDFRGVEQA